MKYLTWNIGDIKITRIVETEGDMELGVFLAPATPEALAPIRYLLKPDWLGEGDISHLSIHCFVIEVGDRRILIDTCVGETGLPDYIPFEINVKYLDELAKAGYPRESIDTVMCTHLHWDHVGWNTMRSGDKWVPSFPNARYLFPKIDYDYWKEQPVSGTNRLFTDKVQLIVDEGLSELVSSDYKLAEGVSLIPSPGHTPGHVCVVIESGGQKAVITGDMAHHPSLLICPDWNYKADVDRAQATATRLAMDTEFVDTDTLIIGSHYPTPTSGKIKKDDKYYYLKGLKSI